MYSTTRQNITIQLVLFKTLVANPKFWLIVSTDVLLLIVANYMANVIRFADALVTRDFFTFSFLTILLICIKIPVFYALGLYRGMWRYTSYSDIFNIIKGTVYAATIVIVILLFTNRFQGYSRSVFILDSLLTFILISGHRVAIRHFYQNIQGSRKLFSRNLLPRKKSLLLVGAGAYAEKVMREIDDNKDLPYIVVGLVDDDPKKTGMKIHGIPVLGLIEDLEEHVRRVKVEEVLIAISSITGPEMQRVVALCQETELPFKVLPGIGEIIDGRVSVKTMRDISYGDLLGRDEVRLDQGEIGSYLSGKIVLVTGAGGSIGSELCRQILRFSPKTLIFFDASEDNLYSIQMEFQHEHKCNSVVPVLGKVQDQGLLELVFQQHKPSVVFHAAAYKHVPLVEKNPWQAIHNNVFAAQLLIETSIVHGVDRFVLVSTDKAVRPTNVMGASKRLTELLMMAYSMDKWDGSFCPARMRLQNNGSDIFPSGAKDSCHSTILMAVRFGNVLGSSGSVIPLFKRQIEMGGPVTVTHPEITRYFMSIEEAAQLILQAGAMGQGREIFILKMGEPIKIVDMARDLIKLAGRDPDTEIEIIYTGLRPGEKLYEELITEGEGIVDTHHEKIMVLQGNGVTCAEIFDGLKQLHVQAKAHDSHGIKATLHQLIPEYTPEYQKRESGDRGVGA